MTHAFVTGASGFIGGHLVRQLRDAGDEVTCLVRPTSDTSQLDEMKPRYVMGDITAPESFSRYLADVDVVYHLAGATKSLRKRDLHRINVEGVRMVAHACAHQRSPPTLVHVSSLAAVGPTTCSCPRIESDEPQPVSNYGRSKLAGEVEVAEFAGDVPITIIRPPIVLGEADRDGLTMFDSIARWNLHLVPGFSEERFSVVHGDDLAAALILASRQGRRLDPEHPSVGRYFVAADESPTYAELGQMVGQALGRDHVRVLHNPKSAVWAIAAINEFASQVRRRAHILGLDKAREATAGSWICSGRSFEQDTGFRPGCDLQARLDQTARWYIEQGWLPEPRFAPCQAS
ncbi:NAD-dependent epimerase/dehydratase family protein [Rhodopirellula islandica]|nr:NAD-dependent epimerase/dehydratase family protein [Rhodopirellula islandica]